MKTTEKGTRIFTKKEELQIIEKAMKKGVKVPLKKYALYPATFYYWKKKLIVYENLYRFIKLSKRLILSSKRGQDPLGSLILLRNT